MALRARLRGSLGSANGFGKLEEPDHASSNWYFTRESIEKLSPSRRDGIDLGLETYFRMSYCTFIQALGMFLKVPQETIATAIVFSQRFFLQQSLSKCDRYMVATICMFLAGKAEETPRALRDVIITSYELRHKKDPVAAARIMQKETYEEQKELVLVGERLVLTALNFDLNIVHPYKPLVAAVKKFYVAEKALKPGLEQIAWNFVNDGLRTSLCLQFKPHHIAAGAIFLAAKFLKVKLPQDGEKVWWQEFGVTPRQLEEVSNQILELYEQNKTLGPASCPSGPRPSDPGSRSVASNRVKGSDSVPSANGNHWHHNSTGADKVDKQLGHTVKTEDVTSSRRDEAHDVAGSNGPSSTHAKQDNGCLGTEMKCLIQMNGSIPFRKHGAVVTVRRLHTDKFHRPGGPYRPLVKEEVNTLEEGEIGDEKFEDGEIKDEGGERKLSTDLRLKSSGKGLDSKSNASEFEVADEQEMPERETGCGVEASAEAEGVRQEPRDSKSTSASEAEHVKRESADIKVSIALKRKWTESSVEA